MVKVTHTHTECTVQKEPSFTLLSAPAFSVLLYILLLFFGYVWLATTVCFGFDSRVVVYTSKKAMVLLLLQGKKRQKQIPSLSLFWWQS